MTYEGVWHMYGRPDRANHLFQVFTDGTFQPIIDTKQRYNATYIGGDFSMQSPDATKIHFGSSMTGRSRTYIAVMARPRAPEQVDWQVEDETVMLQWEPPMYSNEIKGYNVYRSNISGRDYVLLNTELIKCTQWADLSVVPGQPYYYVLTSVEHSGLESSYSHEVSRAGIELPNQMNDHLTLYVEAETAIKDLYTNELPGLAMGADRWEASDWYYVYRHPKSEYGEAAQYITLLDVEQPYYVWARIRSEAGNTAGWDIAVDEKTVEVTTSEQAWTWVRADEQIDTLETTAPVLRLATQDAQAQIDLLCFTTDAAFTPTGARPMYSEVPGKVKNLEVENIQERVNRLRWVRPDSQNISHYQVYASQSPIETPTQEMIIGSPTYESFIDWGLQASTTYYYAVTAVDRQRNESAIVTASATTPVGEPVADIVLTFADGKRDGSFETVNADYTWGDYYVVPETPDENAVEWEIDVPYEGNYVIWIRFLHRGAGSRGGEVRQSIDFQVNGKSMAVLGGETDLNLPDNMIKNGHPMASRAWTWTRPGEINLKQISLTAGTHTVRLENLSAHVRYDALVLTSEPAWLPREGRFQQH